MCQLAHFWLYYDTFSSVYPVYPRFMRIPVKWLLTIYKHLAPLAFYHLCKLFNKSWCLHKKANQILLILFFFLHLWTKHHMYTQKHSAVLLEFCQQLNYSVLQLQLVYTAVRFFRNTWQEARHIHEGDDGNVKSIAEAYETGSLHRGVDVQTTCRSRQRDDGIKKQE